MFAISLLVKLSQQMIVKLRRSARLICEAVDGNECRGDIGHWDFGVLIPAHWRTLSRKRSINNYLVGSLMRGVPMARIGELDAELNVMTSQCFSNLRHCILENVLYEALFISSSLRFEDTSAYSSCFRSVRFVSGSSNLDWIEIVVLKEELERITPGVLWSRIELIWELCLISLFCRANYLESSAWALLAGV